MGINIIPILWIRKQEPQEVQAAETFFFFFGPSYKSK